MSYLKKYAAKGIWWMCAALANGVEIEAQSSDILANRERSSAVWLGCFTSPQPSLGKEFLLACPFLCS